MEQIRLVLAVVLSILVFLIWDFFFVTEPPPKPPKDQQVQQQKPLEREVPQPSEKPYTSQNQRPTAEKQTTAEKYDVTVGSGVAEQPEKTARDMVAVTLETDLYNVDISKKGACFTRFDLKKYKEKNGGKAPLKSLVSPNNAAGTLAFTFQGPTMISPEEGVYTCNAARSEIRLSDQPRTVTFTWCSDKGVVIDKKYTFYPDSYAIGLDVLVKNGAGAPVSGRPGLRLSRYFEESGSRFVFEGPCTFANNQLKEIDISDIKDESPVKGSLEWVAIQNRYFLSGLVPEDISTATMRLSSSGEKDRLVQAEYLLSQTEIRPQTMRSYGFLVFMGPKKIRTLKTFGHNLDKAVNFGWFDIIAKPCLWLMNQIYRVIPNYGIAIIILTIIIKLIFWPLGNKSYRSMGEMKKIQPIMSEIREKYKDDKKKMNEEMMALYKTYKVNPLGGCLPLVVQIPVFIAFYRMLYQAIELRHAPFFLWIDDLSAPERLFSFDVSIPFMHPPTGIPVLTILMGATMFLQQKLQPTPGDPSQAKIMMLMPLFLTVIFINFPSGLVLYFIVNNLISIAQQHYVTQKNQ